MQKIPCHFLLFLQRKLKFFNLLSSIKVCILAAFNRSFICSKFCRNMGSNIFHFTGVCCGWLEIQNLWTDGMFYLKKGKYLHPEFTWGTLLDLHNWWHWKESPSWLNPCFSNITPVLYTPLHQVFGESIQNDMRKWTSKFFKFFHYLIFWSRF